MWLDGLVAVGFDLEEGQVIRDHYPPAFLPSTALKQLASMAFPDTCNFPSEGELFYFFKLSDQNGPEIYCFSSFVQRKDSTNERGYSQSSIVLVSQIRAIEVFNALLKKLRKACMEITSAEDQRKIFSAFCEDLQVNNVQPEAAINGGAFELSVLGQVLRVWVK